MPEDELTEVTTNQTVTSTELTVVSEDELITVSSTTKSMKNINTDLTAKLMINLLVVALMLVLLLVALFVMLAVRYKVKLKRAKKLGLKRREVLLDIELKERDVSLLEETKDPEAVFLSRKRTFDATIFYHFDTDDYFVLNQLLPELEEERDFKLCIHSRNFTPGRDIKDNIEEAIENSKSVIIIMSQGFVDSM